MLQFLTLNFKIPINSKKNDETIEEGKFYKANLRLRNECMAFDYN